jgi:hypothetical protein
MSNEKQALLETLEHQRTHVLGILDGLTSEQLHQAVLPSDWSCLGLVQHLTLDVERFWFRQVVAGDVIEDESSSAWRVAPDTAPETVLDLYREEIARANTIIAQTDLDAAPAFWPDFFGDWRYEDFRSIVLHTITETACHAGHLDAVRELIDGRQWLDLT